MRQRNKKEIEKKYRIVPSVLSVEPSNFVSFLIPEKLFHALALLSALSLV